MESSVIIDGNYFDNGLSTGATQHSYTTIMQVKSDAVISNNVVAGTFTLGFDVYANSEVHHNIFHKITSGGSNSFIKLTSCQCSIKHNRFVRGSSTIHSYVNVTGTAFEQTITDNFFDSTTIDGTSHEQVKGLAGASLYTSNKNQVDYLILSLSDFTHSNEISGYHGHIETDNSDAYVTSGIAAGNYIEMTVEGSQQFNYVTCLPVSNFLPYGSKPLELKLGFTGSGNPPNINTGGNNELVLFIKSQRKSVNYTTNTNSIIDPNTAINQDGFTYSFNNNSAWTDIMNGVLQVVQFDVSGFTDYEMYDNFVSVYFDFRCRHNSGFASITVSPLVVKFKY